MVKEIIFILGGPGSGKGTQCQLLQKKFVCKHISVGDLLRVERKRGSKYSSLINSCINNGKIVPSFITINLIMNEINNSENDIILLDGFPRNLENLNLWNDMNTIKAKLKCIFFDCKHDVMIKRLLKRGLDSGREDDNLEVIKKRLQIFEESTEAVLDYFNQKKLLHRIDTNRKTNIIFDELSYLITL